jgi:hypothetical protein
MIREITGMLVTAIAIEKTRRKAVDVEAGPSKPLGENTARNRTAVRNGITVPRTAIEATVFPSSR